MIQPGAKAPLFKALSTQGELDLASLLDRGPVVIHFFPSVFTPG